MAQYPHCDSSVLHAPHECEHCDQFPHLQQMRVDQAVNFTGETNPDRVPDPATQKRSLEKINAWYGNVPQPYLALHTEDPGLSGSAEVSGAGYARQGLPAWAVEQLRDGDPNVKCHFPKRGWKCSRGAGHGGPCAARPTGWRRLYWYFKLR